jgi:hypothetical protein
MNLCNAQAASCREDNNSGGGGTLRGAFDAAPANSLTVGELGFGTAWNDEPSLRELYDTACASIVRAECEADELRAEVAMLKQGMVMLSKERDEARDTVLKLRRERAAQDAVIATYRDEACRESCRDKAAADGGWANI